MKEVIILGSSRSDGDTGKVVDKVFGRGGIDLFDLNNFNISPFDYEHSNIHDDFIPLIERLIAYDTWIIATPVYWYSMSAQHKIFFDRFSDLLTIRKDLGRKLRGKKLFVIATFGATYPRGFEETFRQICEYLGIEYLGTSFIYTGTKKAAFLQNNVAYIEKIRAKLAGSSA